MSFNELQIEEVRKYKCIYDLSLKEYRNVQKKDQIWEEIGKVVNASSDICRRRWKTLRDAYKKTKRANMLASGSGAPAPSTKWKLQETLSFLDHCEDSRPTTGSLEILEESTIFFEGIEYLEGMSPTNYTMEHSDSQPSCSSSINTSTPIRGRPTKRRADAELNKTFAKAMEECTASISDLAKVPPRNSTFQLFESFAQKIVDANLSPGDVNKIEGKIMLVLHEELAKY